MKDEKFKRWSKHEDVILKEKYPNTDIDSLCKTFGRTKNSVTSRARYLGFLKNKVVILLRHVSGSGSSSLAQYLYDIIGDNAEICCADDFFITNGVYCFNPSRLCDAHSYCKNKFEEALKSNKELVICCNTLTTEKEIKIYVDLASKYNYTLISLICENRHGGKDSHGVPESTLISQETKLRNSLKLR